MKKSKLGIAYTKSFELKPEFAHHFDSNFEWLLLNSIDLLRKCFDLLGAYVTTRAKPSQNFTTAS